MAKKLDLDINTDSFLESIRPEMPPSSTQKKAEEVSEPKQTTSVTEKPKNGTKTAKTENSNIGPLTHLSCHFIHSQIILPLPCS